MLLDDSIGETPEDKDILAQIPSNIPRIFVHNKIDLTNKNASVGLVKDDINIFISAKNLIGIDLLRDEILKSVGFSNNTCDVFIARTRHLDAMKKAVAHIENSFNHWQNLELLAEELRYAHINLTQITGEFNADDLLGEIFSRFCIGK